MKKLWTPWRKEYIQLKEKGCFFCRLVREKNDEANLILYRGRRSFIIMNRYPYNNGHLMVAPIAHKKLEKLSREERSEIFDQVLFAVKALKKVLRCEGINLGANLEKVAGAGVVGHFHFHIVPRWLGDTNFLPVLAETKTIAEYLRETYKKLLPFFQKRER
uniref:HIT domain-containing protein n=1 Tax=candidate division WOR-3 bacterium TaxID=2052148 RepID=A0A7C3UWG4_UNCW3